MRRIPVSIGAGLVPVDFLIELELRRWLAVLRVNDHVLIAIDYMPLGRITGRRDRRRK